VPPAPASRDFATVSLINFDDHADSTDRVELLFARLRGSVRRGLKEKGCSTVSKLARLSAAILRSSILWGGLASFGFYTLIHVGTLEGEFFQRYFAAHWTLYLETTLFFIGVAELLLKAFDTSEQRGRLKKPLLGPLPETPLPIAEAGAVIATLDTQPIVQRNNYLPRRLREAVEGIVRQRSAEKLEDDLKYLSEVDASRAHAGYALMRIIIWAIPILGFLGTVIGITIAIAGLNPQALEASLGEVTAAWASRSIRRRWH